MAKLLIVDDEPSVCYSLEKRLRSETLEVLTAGTARRGLQMVEEHRPDVVLLDVRLPDQSGLDAFEQMHELDLRHFRGNKVLASQRLGISRTTLRAKLSACEPDAPTQAEAE